MKDKGFFKEFAEVTGFDGSWQSVMIGVAATVGLLLIAGIAEKGEEILRFLF